MKFIQMDRLSTKKNKKSDNSLECRSKCFYQQVWLNKKKHTYFWLEDKDSYWLKGLDGNKVESVVDSDYSECSTRQRMVEKMKLPSSIKNVKITGENEKR